MPKQRNFFGKRARDYQIERELREISGQYERLDEQAKDDLIYARYKTIRKHFPRETTTTGKEEIRELVETIEHKHFNRIKQVPQEKTFGDVILEKLGE